MIKTASINIKRSNLDNDLDQQLDWIEIMEIEDYLNSSYKRTLEEVEKISVNSFAIAAYRINSKKVCNKNDNNSTTQSARDPIRFLVLK